MTVTLYRNVEQFIGSPRQLFINGQWAGAASGKTFATPDPATGETLAHLNCLRGRGLVTSVQEGGTTLYIRAS